MSDQMQQFSGTDSGKQQRRTLMTQDAQIDMAQSPAIQKEQMVNPLLASVATHDSLKVATDSQMKQMGTKSSGLS